MYVRCFSHRTARHSCDVSHYPARVFEYSTTAPYPATCHKSKVPSSERRSRDTIISFLFSHVQFTAQINGIIITECRLKEIEFWKSRNIFFIHSLQFFFLLVFILCAGEDKWFGLYVHPAWSIPMLSLQRVSQNLYIYGSICGSSPDRIWMPCT